MKEITKIELVFHKLNNEKNVFSAPLRAKLYAHSSLKCSLES